MHSPRRQGDYILHPRGVQNVGPVDQSSGVIRFRQDRPRQAETKPPAQSRTMYSDVSDIQLQHRRLELDHARQEREREQGERERERDERQQQLELNKLELEHVGRQQRLEMSRASDLSAHPTDPPSSRLHICRTYISTVHGQLVASGKASYK